MYMYYVFHDHLFAVCSGTIPNARHTQYKEHKTREERHAQKYAGFGPITDDDQVRCMSALALDIMYKAVQCLMLYHISI